MRRLVAVLVASASLLAACDEGKKLAPEAGSSTSSAPSSSSSSSRPAPPPKPADQAGSAWRIPAAYAHGIEGFADHASVLSGQPVRLFVSTTASTFQVRAFRMGWYRGALGRLVWTSRAYAGTRQSAPVLVSAATRTMAARWKPSLSVDTTGWLPGDYLLRLDGAGHRQQFIPLTIRAQSAVGALVLINAVTTWQAYNTWGGADLYNGSDGSFATRSRAVSFDRPYIHDDGAGYFISRELPIIAEAERLGLSLDYVTDVDLDAVPGLLRGARAVVSLGHDEYWSPRMRAVVTAARDAGTNLAFFGANAVFRRIRFGPTALGANRLEINYKDAYEDPLNGKNPAAVTSDWPAPPAANPESRLLGAQYGCFPAGARVPGVVADPTNWMFAGVTVTAGEKLPGLIGPELDAVQLNYPTPRPIEVLLHSPANCPGNSPAFADTTYYVAHSGAGVFDAGTIDWVCAVGATCGARVHGPTTSVVRTITDNVLLAFSRGPAGRVHPAHDNLAALKITS